MTEQRLKILEGLALADLPTFETAEQRDLYRQRYAHHFRSLAGVVYPTKVFQTREAHAAWYARHQWLVDLVDQVESADKREQQRREEQANQKTAWLLELDERVNQMERYADED